MKSTATSATGRRGPVLGTELLEAHVGPVHKRLVMATAKIVVILLLDPRKKFYVRELLQSRTVSASSQDSDGLFRAWNGQMQRSQLLR